MSPPLHRLRDFRLYQPNPTFGNPPWEEASLRVLIMRLSPFSDVQRSTPHVVIAQEVRRALPDAFIDMAFLPEEQDRAVLTESGLPLLTGTQSQRGVSGFDLVLVSNSWLLEQVNLPFLLARSGIPLWAGERGAEWPPIILGGSNASAAHSLVSAAGDCMADAIFFGEGEGWIGRIALLSRTLGTLPKTERIRRIAAEVTGLWPAGDRETTRVRAIGETRAPGPGHAFLLPGPEAGTTRLSITRGCPCLCTFCFEGYDRRPFREIPTAELVAAARGLKIATGADTLEIESNNFNTHSGIAELIPALQRLFLRVNLMSQRVDILARTPGLLDLEIAADKRSFTLGVEGISGRLRRFLHKSLSDEDIRRALEDIHRQKTREIKLFYILTGREDEQDIVEFTGFVKWLKEIRQRTDAPPRMVFSFGLLVRMPFTPLRHDPPVLDEQVWRATAGRVKSICQTNGFEYRLAMDWPRHAATQVLALGGHELAPLLERLSRAGPVGDGRLAPDARLAVTEWIQRHEGALDGEKPLGRAFGFPFLDTEETKARLYGQYIKAKAERDDGYCRQGAPGNTACAACTAECTRQPRRTDRRNASLAPLARSLRDLMQTKHKLKPVIHPARLPRAAAGFGADWTNAWFLRTLLSRHPDQADNILSMTESLVGPSGLIGDETPWFGATMVGVTAWDATGLARLMEEAEGSPAAGAAGGDAADGGAADGPANAGVNPAAWERVRVIVTLPAALFPDPAARLAEFLRDMHAPVTLSREGGLQRLTVPEKSLKKKILLAGSCVESGGSRLLDLLVGTKPFIPEWLRSFGDPCAARAALVEIREIL